MGFWGELFKEIVSSFGGSNTTWYCDGCNSILNDQPGFTTRNGRWKCSVCGFDNDVTSDNVYESEDAYQKAMGIPRCPKCGSIVQGSSPDAQHWFNCKTCGTRFYLQDGELIDPFDSDIMDTKRTCSNCGQSLRGADYIDQWEDGNNVFGYAICPHCGYYNYNWDDD